MSDVQSIVQYRDVIGFHGYRVGDDGSVWSKWNRVAKHGRLGGGGTLGNTWRRMGQSIKKDGYCLVMLAPGRRQRYVHRLVLEAFVGPCPDGKECCHTDGNRRNNALTNLRWDTRRANCADAERHGTKTRGERHGRAKLTADQVRRVRSEHDAGYSYEHLARTYGMAPVTIRRICLGLLWKHVH